MLGDVMSVEEKIINYLLSQKFTKNATFSKTNISSGRNKDGSNLLYVSASILEKQFGVNYSNNSIYYAFDMKGNYVGCVKVHILTTSQVEMEYYTNEEYKNKGNITILAQEVIRDIFEKNLFNNLKVGEGMPTSHIESIMVAINNDNFASLAVAKKLGFDVNGYLHIDDYYKNIESKTSNIL